MSGTKKNTSQSAQKPEDATQPPKDDEQKPGKDALPQAEYLWVEFSEKASKHEPEMVKIWVDGVGLQFGRGVPTIAPRPYLDAADHAIIEKFQQEPGKAFKKRAGIKRFPYTILYDRGKRGLATAKEYREFLVSGTKRTREEYDGAGEHSGQ